MSELPKIYDPKIVENKWYKYWIDNRLFETKPSEKEPYCIMMPPPNITGELHMGHALQDSVQDLLIRYKRMQGYESHWQAGKDHAGIATQNVVLRELKKTKGLTRQNLSREEFLKSAWDWCENYGNRIFEQKQLLGDSCDWEQERFTLDEGLSLAVSKVFVHLYDKGLIYRGNYIVNWCPKCLTAISDEEVFYKEHQSHLWHFKYPLKDNPDEFIVVATTRPETMLGDTAIAVNPADERYKHLIGKMVLLPIANRFIKVIADDFVDPTFGTGQVKVTPAHDPNDFQMAQRHNLEKIIIMDSSAVMNENVPDGYRGLDRYDARDKVVKELDDLGFLAKIDDYTTSIGHCQRCDTVIEPYLSTQWFVKMKPLAEPAIEAVKKGEITFYPARWEKVYYSWMENIRDWCISRQLWWGHRIPVWYCNDCDLITVSAEEAKECKHCKSANIRQDEDVLDTWFSSWLWPFSTLGWPNEIDSLKFWYPTNVLVSGYDIIFFWIARMIMAGIEFTGKIPYKDVYITGMVRDEQGRWMSKSLGNGIDPRQMVNEYGADAVRYTLVTLASEGQDIKLSPSRFEGGRNFANKLWNSFRFVKHNLDKYNYTPKEVVDIASLIDLNSPLSNRWIVSRFASALEKIQDSVDKYKLNDYALTTYDFLWKEYCDWYLEFVKVQLNDDDSIVDKENTLSLLANLFGASMRMLHPIMPFITEEIYSMLYESEGEYASIMRQPYPNAEYFKRDMIAENEMDFLQNCIGAIRTVRSEMQVPQDRQGSLVINGATDEQKRILNANRLELSKFCSLNEIQYDAERPKLSVACIVGNIELFLPLEGLIDIEKEKARLGKEVSRLESIIKGSESKLNNANFVSNAPEQIIQHEKQKLEDCKLQLQLVKNNLSLLG